MDVDGTPAADPLIKKTNMKTSFDEGSSSDCAAGLNFPNFSSNLGNIAGTFAVVSDLHK